MNLAEDHAASGMDEQAWANSWKEHLASYQRKAPRTGYFVRTLLPDIGSALELGCGSGRDSAYLATKGYRATASDYEPDLIDRLAEANTMPGLTFKQADAFNLPFDDDSYDLVFHNGLIVLFDDDEQIKRLLSEQRRVARKYLLIIAHNDRNTALKQRFARLAQDDPIYRIRFFDPDTVAALARTAVTDARQIRLLKFGGRVDALSNPRPRGLRNPFAQAAGSVVPSMYQWLPWSRVERVACLVALG